MKKEFKIGLVVCVIVLIGVVIIFARHNPLARPVAQIPAEPNIAPVDINTPPIADSNRVSPLPGGTAKSDANSMPAGAPAVNTGSGNPANDSTVYEQSDKITTTRFHVVQHGDTLSSISKKYYGNTRNIEKLYEANRSIIKNKNNLKVGTKLTIPD
jgi:nucleoid-associated protein YgaU